MIEEESKDKNPGNILVVDALNLAFRWKHMGKLDFEYDYIRTVESLAKSYDCGKVVITADWGSSSYRKELYPEYKENRKEKFKDQTEKEKLEFELFFSEYETTLESLKDKFLVSRYKNVEADDLAAYIAKTFSNYNIWMVSSDRDWDLLVDSTCSRFSYVTRKETTIHNWDEHYDVDREHYISYKCLIGDSGDNIPGIAGIGPVKAKQLIETYGTVFDIYSSCPIESKYKYIQSLNENCEQLMINFSLMDLENHCEEAIGEDNLSDFRKNLMEYLIEN